MLRRSTYKGSLIFIFLVASISAAQNKGKFVVAGFDDDTTFTSYYARFQKAVQFNDSNYISRLLDYPFTVSEGPKKNLRLKNRNSFLTNYSKIFDERLRKLILSQSTDSLFANSNGVMVGRGQIWFAYIQDEKGTRIIIWSLDNYDLLYQH